MSVIRVEDGGGSSLKLMDIDGYRICTFNNEPEVETRIFRQLPELQFRPDDVLICAPIKCGTHWTWEVVSMIRNRSTQYMEGSKVEKMIEAKTSEDVDSVPSPRTLNTHLQNSLLPPSAISQRVPIIFVARNPKDMLVSWYNHCKGITVYDYDGKFEDFLNLFFKNELEYGDYFEYLLEWERVIKEKPDLVHLVYYEDMKEDLPREIQRIAKFLGVSIDENLCQEIAKSCSFVEMAKNKDYKQEIQEMLYKGNFSMYRKGNVGGWKDVFTVAQNEMFDKIWAERMKDSTLKFRYTL